MAHLGTSSDTPGAAEYLEYDVSVGPNGVLERTGIVIDATKKVVVRSSQASVTSMVMGRLDIPMMMPRPCSSSSRLLKTFFKSHNFFIMKK